MCASPPLRRITLQGSTANPSFAIAQHHRLMLNHQIMAPNKCRKNGLMDGQIDRIKFRIAHAVLAENPQADEQRYADRERGRDRDRHTDKEKRRYSGNNSEETKRYVEIRKETS